MHITKGSDTRARRLEPDAGKLARPVLRGLEVSNGLWLPGGLLTPGLFIFVAILAYNTNCQVG